MAADHNHSYTLQILAGATASGKSTIAQLLATQMDCSILSADAMSVYRDMNIGTAKTTPAERNATRYYGIDLVTPAERCTAGLWLESAYTAITELSRSVTPSETSLTNLPLIVAGGTGLYIKALTNGLDGNASNPHRRAHWEQLLAQQGVTALQQAATALKPGILEEIPDPSNPRRLIRALEHLETTQRLPQSWYTPTTPPHITALRLPRPQLHQRIKERVIKMFATGLLEETSNLRLKYPHWSETARHAIGYAEALAVLEGSMNQDQAIERIAARTRQLAKRQETWLRHQFDTHWIEISIDDSAPEIAAKVAEQWRQHGPTKIRYQSQ